MPKKNPSVPLVLTSRRALHAWLREALEGTCVIESISPKPLVWRKQGDALPKPKPRAGKVSLCVYPSEQPAHTRVTARHFELRVPEPVQWLARETFTLPHETTLVGTSRGVWDPVGLDCQGFWFSGARMTVRELPPRIMVIPPDYHLGAWEYAFDDPSQFPSPAWWLDVVGEAGCHMVPIDIHGFPTTVDKLAAEGWWWHFAERRPLNLRSPLWFEVTFHDKGGFRFRVHGSHEKEREMALEAALVVACERLPHLRVRSGNCNFSIAEWQRLRAQAAVETQAEVEAETGGGNVVQLDARRRS